MAKYIDRTGQKFGHIIIIKMLRGQRVGIKKYYYKSKCIGKCDCGNISEYWLGCLVSGNTTSCGCEKSRLARENSYTGNSIISGSKLAYCKGNANTRNIEFDITVNDILRVFNKQDGRCCHTGEPIRFPTDSTNNGNRFKYSSIDRIDHTKPYIINNIQLCTAIYNSMRWTLSNLQFYKYIKQIIEYQDGIFIPNKRLVVDNVKHPSNFVGYKTITSHEISRLQHRLQQRKRQKCSKIKYSRNTRLINEDFNIDCRYIWDIYKKQGFICNLSGLDIDFISVWFRKINKVKGTASVDRINSSKGYIKRNIQILHKDINIMKLDLSNKDFIKLCRKIYDYKNLSCQTLTVKS